MNRITRHWSSATGLAGPLQPPVKPVDVFNESAYPDMLRLRRWYDEFILYADREFGPTL